MTYAEFSAEVRRRVFPEGEAENLEPRHRNFVLDALIDLQLKLPCLQTRHTDCHTQPDTLWNCGATVFDAPRGYIISLRTSPSDNPCAMNWFDPVTEHDFRCLLEDAQCHRMAVPMQTYDDSVYPTLYGGDMYSSAGIDSACVPSKGVFTLSNGRIWMFPFINQTDTAILEWDGIKRDYDDADLVEFDRPVTQLVELYLEAEAKRIDDCDKEAWLAAFGRYRQKLADEIHECEKQRRLPVRKACFSNCDWPAGICHPATTSPSPFLCQPA